MPVQEMAVSPVKSLYWEQLPPMSQRRVYCTPVHHEGLLYVLGGCSETGVPLDSVEVLDVESQTWSQLPPLPTARAGAAAVALGGQVMVLGGMNQQQTPLASVETYHPDEGKWETRAGLGQPSMGVTTVEKGRRVQDVSMFLLCKGRTGTRAGSSGFFCVVACRLLSLGPVRQDALKHLDVQMSESFLVSSVLLVDLLLRLLSAVTTASMSGREDLRPPRFSSQMVLVAF
uniref:Kelch domain-containing protein 8B n=1 Tax=Stegastes partitus TaxID=144197 RepID=A0A3B5A8R7_9TELE